MWAGAIAAGIPNELFWELTDRELQEVFKILMEEERREYLRAGLISASVYNANRPKGRALVRPGDFFREAPQEGDFMEITEAQNALDAWAATENLAHPVEETPNVG